MTRTHRIAEAPESGTCTLAGRYATGQLHDATGTIALTFAGDPPGERDLIYAEGERKGESFRVSRWEPAVASTGPSPDPDLTPKLLERRAALLRAVRSFFDERGFIEAVTPVLFTASTFNPHIREFRTRFVSDDEQRDLFLQTSPEHFMKRCLTAGAERIYQIAPFFRNGEVTDHHNPEFLGLEFYEAWSDYRRIMELTEAMVVHVVQALNDSHRLGDVDLTAPWERLSVAEAFSRHAGIDLSSCRTRDALADAAKSAGIRLAADDQYDDVFFRVFLELIEPHLGVAKPTFLYDYPPSMAVMARVREDDDARWAERVELFIGGAELANGFSEETDAREQRARFEADRKTMGLTDQALDEGFLAALSHGMPPASGIALGLDRLLMLLEGTERIGDVLPFPFAHYAR